MSVSTHSLSSPGSTGRSSIPETAVMEPRGRGVLDSPPQCASAHKAGNDSCTWRTKSMPHTPSLRAQRSNPDCHRGKILDCFAALAMTMWRDLTPYQSGRLAESHLTRIASSIRCAPPSGERRRISSLLRQVHPHMQLAELLGRGFRRCAHQEVHGLLGPGSAPHRLRAASRPGHERGECRCRLVRHCERSEAIQIVTAERFWIASLRSQ